MEITAAQINSVLTICGFLAASYLLSWQVRVWPADRQAWAALSLIASLTIILGLVALATAGILPFAMTWRSNVSYGLVMLALMWLAWETRRINQKILRERRKNLRPK